MRLTACSSYISPVIMVVPSICLTGRVLTKKTSSLNSISAIKCCSMPQLIQAPGIDTHDLPGSTGPGRVVTILRIPHRRPCAFCHNLAESREQAPGLHPARTSQDDSSLVRPFLHDRPHGPL